jgi:hypothetical protein
MLHNRLISNNPHSQKIFGRVHCDYINTLLKDYESNGPTPKNPFPNIDSSRLTGLNSYHPFAKHLFRLPIERITFILSELEYKSNSENNVKNINEIFNNNDIHRINDEIFKKLGIALVTDFKLEKIEDIILPPVIQKFQVENVVLKYSRPRIDKKRKEIKKELIENKDKPREEPPEDKPPEDKPPKDPDMKNTKEKTDINLMKSAKLSINFVDQVIDGKYEVFASNSGIIINIPKTNYIVQKYVINNTNSDKAFTDSRFKAYVADIIVEAFADIMTNSDINNQDLTGINQSQMLELINSTYNKNYSSLEKKIYEIILG